MKKILIGLIVLIVGIGIFFALKEDEVVITVEESPVKSQEVIGSSVEGRPIEAFSYGKGEKEILFVGGIHGGYEWNGILLAETFIKHLEENPDFVPDGLKLTVIPNANPDGLFAVLGREGAFEPKDVPKETVSGRFNANDVDLNRNFDCLWQAESVWRGNPVSAGENVFSEPESKAIRDYVLKNQPEAVVFWHSQANTVYASGCNGEVLDKTRDIMKRYAEAAGYKTSEVFDAYVVTGDAGDWVSSIGIPAITVELETHETIEWQRNLEGIKALLVYFR